MINFWLTSPLIFYNERRIRVISMTVRLKRFRGPHRNLYTGRFAYILIMIRFLDLGVSWSGRWEMGALTLRGVVRNISDRTIKAGKVRVVVLPSYLDITIENLQVNGEGSSQAFERLAAGAECPFAFQILDPPNDRVIVSTRVEEVHLQVEYASPGGRVHAFTFSPVEMGRLQLPDIFHPPIVRALRALAMEKAPLTRNQVEARAKIPHGIGLGLRARAWELVLDLELVLDPIYRLGLVEAVEGDPTRFQLRLNDGRVQIFLHFFKIWEGVNEGDPLPKTYDANCYDLLKELLLGDKYFYPFVQREILIDGPVLDDDYGFKLGPLVHLGIAVFTKMPDEDRLMEDPHYAERNDLYEAQLNLADPRARAVKYLFTAWRDVTKGAIPTDVTLNTIDPQHIFALADYRTDDDVIVGGFEYPIYAVFKNELWDFVKTHLRLEATEKKFPILSREEEYNASEFHFKFHTTWVAKNIPPTFYLFERVGQSLPLLVQRGKERFSLLVPGFYAP